VFVVVAIVDDLVPSLAVLRSVCKVVYTNVVGFIAFTGGGFVKKIATALGTTYYSVKLFFAVRTQC